MPGTAPQQAVGGGDAAELVLDAVGLRKRFGDRTAVDGVSFHIGRGETYGLLGPNGAGKSTTISMIAGLLAADEGGATVAGVPIRPGSTAGRGGIGLVPQDLAVYPDLSAEENLHFFATLQGMGRADRSARVDEVLDLIGLAERRSDRVSTHSGGMQRRLNIGIGLLHRPQLLILDEPTVGVDPQSRNAILASVEALAVEGMAVLYTTHYMEEAERLCDRIGIVDEGRLLAEGTADELVALLERREHLRLRVPDGVDAALDAVRALGVVRDATASEGSLDVLVDDVATGLSPVIGAVTAAGATVDAVDIDRPDLEAVFLHLTGKGLRDR